MRIIERELHILNKIDLDWATAAGREDSCEQQHPEALSELHSLLVHFDSLSL